jgi:hypothetical protein
MTPIWSTLLRRMGLPGLLGLCLLAGAAWLHWAWMPRQQVQTDDLGSQTRRLRHELLAASAAPAASVAQLTPETAWSALVSGLPDATQRLRLQSQVMDSARTKGLTMAAVQFKGGQDGVPGVWRQRVVVPVEGRYSDVRAWVADLLREPALSLDALDIQRTDVMSDAVKARVSVSLWWRTAPSAKGGH